jgi:hemerythrin superfamily protein
MSLTPRRNQRDFLELRQYQKEGKIKNLEIQPVFELQEGFKDTQGRKHRPITYIADFSYIDGSNMVVEDVKGMLTEVYKLKKKLFIHKYEHIRFVEV